MNAFERVSLQKECLCYECIKRLLLAYELVSADAYLMGIVDPDLTKKTAQFYDHRIYVLRGCLGEVEQNNIKLSN